MISLLSAGQRRERLDKYGTKTRSESLLDLRAAAATPPSRRRKNDLPQLGEEEEEEDQRGYEITADTATFAKFNGY